MANVTVAGTDYTGITSVELPITGQDTKQAFIIPAGTVSITENGTTDVSAYAQATVSVPGPTLQEKTATPSETAQEITPGTGYDGLSKVTVDAVSSTYVGTGVPRKAAATITPGAEAQTVASGQYLTGAQIIAGDADLAPGNIKSGVNIFGVTGSYGGDGVSLQTKNATPSASQQVISPDSGYDGLSSVTIAGDADLAASNIKSGVNIFGVDGSYAGEAPSLQSKSVTANGTYTPDSGYDGFSQVTVNVPSSGGGSGFSGTPTAGDTPVLAAAVSMEWVASGSSLASTGLTITIPIAGTYRVKFGLTNSRDSASTSYATYGALYKNGAIVGDTGTSTARTLQTVSNDVLCAAGDVLTVYAYSANALYTGIVCALVACINWANGFEVA